MTIMERFVLSRSEKHLAKYRRTAKGVSDALLGKYQTFLPSIEHTYAQVAYWHGTGRYHYYHRDAALQGAPTEGVIDILDSILTNRGIVGHQDLWFWPGGREVKTISVAPSRMHARLYAHVHLCDGEWLEYVFGGTRFWASLFVMLAAKDIFSTKHSGGSWDFVKQTILDRPLYKIAHIWAGAVRSTHNTLPPAWRAYDLRSDIVGNHPILFGIKKEAVTDESVVPFLRRIEVRIPGSISLRDITHIEVPQARMEEVVALLISKNISLPVIPLETGELYCSNFSLPKLIYV